jgi:hypothetical protein
VSLSLGLAITTIGRPCLGKLLMSAASSTRPPDAVAIANQAGRDLLIDEGAYPFPVRVVPSSGGVSIGRNDAVRALRPDIEIIGFPNDTSTYRRDSLERAIVAFSDGNNPDAVAGNLIDGDGSRRDALPSNGEPLDRATVWRAIEPAYFLRRSSLEGVGGFRPDLGTGSSGPWQSGEGTDLLLRLMAKGGVILSMPELIVEGPGGRHLLSVDEWVAKNRRYARGTGYVYRIHRYPLPDRLKTLLGPLVLATRHDAELSVSLRLAIARSVGRLEGLIGHPIAQTRFRSSSRHVLETGTKG